MVALTVRRKKVKAKKPKNWFFIPPGDVMAFDTETTGGNARKSDAPFAFSFCNEQGQMGYMEFPVDPMTRRVMYEKESEQLEELIAFLESSRIAKVMHNAKFDYRMCVLAISKAIGRKIHFRGEIHETMFAAHACNSSEMTFALKPLSKKYAGISDEDQKELQKAVTLLRRRAKKLGWAIAGSGISDAAEDEEGGTEAKGKKKSKVALDYWLCFYAKKLLPDRPDEAKRIRKLCKTYATYDALRTMVLWKFYSKLMKRLKVRNTYDAEMALWPLNLWIEDRGVRVDPKEVQKLYSRYHAEYVKWSRVLKKYGDRAIKAGAIKPKNGVFNPNSHQQLAGILYEFLGLKPPPQFGKKKKSKTGRPTNQDALMELSASSSFPDAIIKHRAASKALQFIRKYKSAMLEQPDGQWILYADFNQVGPRTGRYSCRNPNLQQTASKNTGRSANPIDVRSPFGPRSECIWYAGDYSQVEPRIFADLSGEPTMLSIIKSGKHIHKTCADHVWGGFKKEAYEAASRAVGINLYQTRLEWKKHPHPDDKPEMAELREKYGWNVKRILEAFDGSIVALESAFDKKNTVNKAKLAIFTKLYGGGIPSIMNLMKCSREYASQFLQEYSEGFPEMDPWIQSVTRKARKEGGIRTAFDRWIRVDPDFAYRGVNYMIQGSAADLMKRALTQTARYLRRELPDQAWIVMTIHDEIVFEFLRSVPPMRHIAALKALMEDHGGVLGVPTPTEFVQVRKRWTDKAEIPWVNKISKPSLN